MLYIPLFLWLTELIESLSSLLSFFAFGTCAIFVVFWIAFIVRIKAKDEAASQEAQDEIEDFNNKVYSSTVSKSKLLIVLFIVFNVVSAVLPSKVVMYSFIGVQTASYISESTDLDENIVTTMNNTLKAVNSKLLEYSQPASDEANETDSGTEKSPDNGG